MKKKTATFLVTIEWTESKKQRMTPTMARDKLLTPLQELWILHAIDKFSLEEVEQKRVSLLSRENEEGERTSYYKTSFPKPKKK